MFTAALGVAGCCKLKLRQIKQFASLGAALLPVQTAAAGVCHPGKPDDS